LAFSSFSSSFIMAASPRRVVFCVGDRPAETAATWAWACTHVLEPARDRLTLLRAFTGNRAKEGASKVKVEAGGPPPEWAPPLTEESWSAFAQGTRAVELSSPILLPEGAAIADYLASLSQHEAADLVIVGSRGRDSRMARLILGSASAFLVEEGVAPIIVVRPMAAAVAEPATPRIGGLAGTRKVALAVDPKPAVAAALARWAAATVLRPTDAVLLMHGPGSKAVAGDVRAATIAALEALGPWSDANPHAAKPEVVMLADGDVRDALVDKINEEACDIAILGRRSGGSLLRRPVLGSVSSYVLHHAGACGVLVVPNELLEGGVTARDNDF